MLFTLSGLILATFFGMFFGSEGELDPETFNIIFWGLIGSGAFVNFLAIVRDSLCKSCHCGFCHGH